MRLETDMTAKERRDWLFAFSGQAMQGMLSGGLNMPKGATDVEQAQRGMARACVQFGRVILDELEREMRAS